MQVELLKNIIASIAGQNASSIVNSLYNAKNVNEFVIAKKLKLTINQTRNILYRLADEGVVSFIRKKDRKKGGWYTYFWTLNTGKGLIKFRGNLQKEVEKLSNQLNLKKTERFYYCANCSIESNEETALIYRYTCPECGEVLQLKDKAKEVDALEKEIARLGKILESLEQEIGIITKKEEVVKARKRRAEDKKKTKERALKRKNRGLEAKKLKSKQGREKSMRKKNKFLGKKIGKKIRKFFGR